MVVNSHNILKDRIESLSKENNSVNNIAVYGADRADTAAKNSVTARMNSREALKSAIGEDEAYTFDKEAMDIATEESDEASRMADRSAGTFDVSVSRW